MTADLQATLDAIDTLAVHQCGHCSRPLSEDGQSLDFCDDYCQQAWVSNRNEVVELIGYREPWDVPAYQGNLVELYSPEVTPPWEPQPIGPVGISFTCGISPLEAAMRDMWARTFTTWQEQILGDLSMFQPQGIRVEFNTAPILIFDEVRHFSLRAPTTEPEPLTQGEPFDPDYEYDWRPVPGLHDDEPPPPVMAPLPERDWQALIDASRPQVAFAPSPQGSSHRTRRTR